MRLLLVLLFAALTPGLAAATSPCQTEYYWPAQATMEPIELPSSASLFLVGNDPPALFAPDGAGVDWEASAPDLGITTGVQMAQPAGGWSVGEYVDSGGNGVYVISDEVDDEPPVFSVQGWEGLDPTLHIGCGSDWYQRSRVRLDIEAPDEPWTYVWRVLDGDGDEVSTGWGPVREWGLEVPVDAAAKHDIEFTTLDGSGNTHTELIEGVRGCGGCSSQMGGDPGAGAWAWLLAGALLLGRRRFRAQIVQNV